MRGLDFLGFMFIGEQHGHFIPPGPRVQHFEKPRYSNFILCLLYAGIL